jgi:hypothetical protein
LAAGDVDHRESPIITQIRETRMRIMALTSRFAMFLVTSLSMLEPTIPAWAQDSGKELDSILEDIENRTDRYSRFRALLSDPDQSKRMAAFSGMMNSGILTLQNIALDYAFNSGDTAMQSAALHVLLTRTKALSFDIDFSGNYSEETQSIISGTGGGGFAIDIDAWDTTMGTFSGGNNYGVNQHGTGQVSGLTLHYSSRSCRTSVSLDDSTKKMVGQLSCDNFKEPVRVSLSIR